ncbi:MAG: hypothetical protein ACPL7O_11110 [Armatimonadota bacterium]
MKEKGLEEKKVILEAEYNPNDPWLFTAESAKDTYRRRGESEELERDIRNSVMGGKPWRPEDLEYLKEIQRLVNEGVVEQDASRWAVSPFPPIYRALRDGEMAISGRTNGFKKGEQIVFQCKMSRERNGLPGPVLIGRFKPALQDRYCGDMGGMKEHEKRR